MDTESNKFLLESIRLKHENAFNSVNVENSEGIRVKIRALLVGLLGVSMSACALASQPVELELDDEEVTQRLNNVSFARRLTKPTIRLVMGYSKLSAFVTGATSLLLLIAVMSKLAPRMARKCARTTSMADVSACRPIELECYLFAHILVRYYYFYQSWWHRGARWLAAPALLVAALETASDASDALLAAVLRGPAEPVVAAAQTIAACFLITVEILVWYFIAKFFEYNPPPLPTDMKKDSLIKTPIVTSPQ